MTSHPSQGSHALGTPIPLRRGLYVPICHDVVKVVLLLLVIPQPGSHVYEPTPATSDVIKRILLEQENAVVRSAEVADNVLPTRRTRGCSQQADEHLILPQHLRVRVVLQMDIIILRGSIRIGLQDAVARFPRILNIFTHTFSLFFNTLSEHLLSASSPLRQPIANAFRYIPPTKD
jgi:hypothetical protein